MFEVKDILSSDNKWDFYGSLAQQLSGLLDGEPDAIANAANMSALIYQFLPDLNWAGFYFMRGPELVLGPFQGRTACVRIAVGRGVCGTAVERKASIVVPDVHAFPGHIACGGLAGLTAALKLARSGRKVVLLEARRVAWGASGRNGGFVSAGYATGLPSIERRVGKDQAKELFRLSMEGVEIIRDTIAELGIEDARLVPGIAKALRYD